MDKEFLRNRRCISFNPDIIDAILKNQITIIVKENSDKIPEDAKLVTIDYDNNHGNIEIYYDSEYFSDDTASDVRGWDEYHSGYLPTPKFKVLATDKVAEIMSLYKQIQAIMGGDADGK